MMRKPIIGLLLTALAGSVLLRAAARELKRRPLLVFVLLCGVLLWSMGPEHWVHVQAPLWRVSSAAP